MCRSYCHEKNNLHYHYLQLNGFNTFWQCNYDFVQLWCEQHKQSPKTKNVDIRFIIGVPIKTHMNDMLRTSGIMSIRYRIT